MDIVMDKTSYYCQKCNKFFVGYRVLLHHMYWKHGTESSDCEQCPIKVWVFAHHLCGVLPFDNSELTAEEEEPQVMKTYCICGKGEQGEMIACDNPKCPTEWYHFECIGITKAPEGDWWCPTCLAEKNVCKMVSHERRGNCEYMEYTSAELLRGNCTKHVKCLHKTIRDMLNGSCDKNITVFVALLPKLGIPKRIPKRKKSCGKQSCNHC